MTLLLNSGFSRTGRDNSVLIQPGAIALTRMPSSTNAIANDFVSETTAVLAALYAGTRGEPKYEYIEPMLMRQPLLAQVRREHVSEPQIADQMNVQNVLEHVGSVLL